MTRASAIDLGVACRAARPLEWTWLWLLVAAAALLAPATTIFRRQLPWSLVNAASVGVLAAYLCATIALELSRAPRWLPAVAGVLAAPLLGGFHLLRSPTFPAPEALAWAVFLPVGCMLCLLPFALVKDLLWVMCGRKLGAGSRRALAAGALALGLLAFGVGLYQARRTPRVVEVVVPVADLPASLDGFRVVQLSDLHVGQTVDEGFVRRVVSRVNRLDADAIVVTGDLVDQSPHNVRAKLVPLRELRARLGAFYVGGNHERSWGAAAWRREIARLGLVVLDPGRRHLGGEGSGLELIGLADRPDPRAPAPRRCTGTCLVIAHRAREDTEVLVARRLGAALLLAGHTHGGQVFPAHLVARRGHSHLAGLRRSGRLWVYVSRGTGVWGPPLRIGAPSEIVLIRLRSIGESKCRIVARSIGGRMQR